MRLLVTLEYAIKRTRGHCRGWLAKEELERRLFPIALSCSERVRDVLTVAFGPYGYERGQAFNRVMARMVLKE